MRKIGIKGIIALAIMSGLLSLAAAPAFGAQTFHKTYFSNYHKNARPYHIDNGKPGPSRGDVMGGSFKLYKHHELKGWFEYKCTTVRMHPKRFMCETATKIYGKGTIYASGDVRAHKRTIRLAVTGGNGRFGPRPGGTIKIEFTRVGARFTYNVIH